MAVDLDDNGEVMGAGPPVVNAAAPGIATVRPVPVDDAGCRILMNASTKPVLTLAAGPDEKQRSGTTLSQRGQAAVTGGPAQAPPVDDVTARAPVSCRHGHLVAIPVRPTLRG